MAHIDIRRSHALSHEHARASAEQVAAHLDQRFDLTYRWEGNSLHFQRAGVDGHIDVEETEVWIRVHLGLLLLPMKGLFEREIHRYMDQLFEGV